MATYEHTALQQYKDQNGDMHLLYPITKAENVDGLYGDAALTGVPTAPTAATGTNTTQVATTAFVQQELEDVKKSVSDGKTAVADAITAKGVETATDAAFATMAANIGAIESGGGFPNGTEWSTISIEGETGFTSIYYADGIFVAGGNTGPYYSTDGKNWEKANLSDVVFINVHKANGVFVAISEYDGVFYSTDGKTWNRSNINKSTNKGNVYYANGIWVAVYAGVFYSTDGKTWSSANINTSVRSAKVYNANGIWVLVSYTSNAGIYYSTDGKTWSQSNITSGDFDCVRNGNGVWVAGSAGEGFYYSTDGKMWNRSDNANDDHIYGVCYANGLWVGVGYDHGYYSIDGKTWNLNNAGNYTRNAIKNANGIWVLGSDNGSRSGLSYSKDGKTWNDSNILTGYYSNVIHANGVWYASCYNRPYICYSVSYE